MDVFFPSNARPGILLITFITLTPAGTEVQDYANHGINTNEKSQSPPMDSTSGQRLYTLAHQPNPSYRLPKGSLNFTPNLIISPGQCDRKGRLEFIYATIRGGSGGGGGGKCEKELESDPKRPAVS
ncbi:hypothetical protein ZHAS_00022267 [Anopheles sinensis]|uniref:Uncharacterized protein n=1 Tax=Anopheles sinensis TaxID=74873 RepID=A0A084WUW8_ANOSI|nr:hypothetical protein ZHAS_00022267 [Anopheles sinensis]